MAAAAARGPFVPDYKLFIPPECRFSSFRLGTCPAGKRREPHGAKTSLGGGGRGRLVDGGERRVDLAEVNGRVFVNNVSLGLYAEAVQRSGYRDAKLRTLVETVPDVLEITAETADGVIMGLQQKRYPVHGVQFHPESIASEHGHQLLANFLDLARVERRARASSPREAVGAL